MTTPPNTSTFLAGKFVPLDYYNKAREDCLALEDRLLETIASLSKCLDRRDSAEGMLKSLKFQRHANGVWVNTEL
jgi:hypothetical protein